MIAIGFMVGMQLAAREARRIDVDAKGDFDQFILDLTFWILIVSMLGARLLFVFVEWNDSYLRNPYKIIAFWEGGFVFYGGLISSMLFGIWYCRHHKRPFFLVADTLLPSVALGHFFGRIGCIAAGCCWGTEVSPEFPLAIQYPAGSQIHYSMIRSEIIASDASHTIHVHPVQLYESMGELSIFFILIAMRSVKRFHGQVFLGYLFLYPILRTSLEFIRGDKARGTYQILGTTLSTSQIISIIVAITAFAVLAYLLKRQQGQQSTASSKTAKAT